MSTIYIPPMRPDELYHYGILGMKWGVRRYQNEDGTLTTAGRKRYGNISTDYNDPHNLRKTPYAKIWKNRDKYYKRYEVLTKKYPQKYEGLLEKGIKKYEQMSTNEKYNKAFERSINVTEKAIWNKQFLKNESNDVKKKRRKELIPLMILLQDYS